MIGVLAGDGAGGDGRFPEQADPPDRRTETRITFRWSSFRIRKWRATKALAGACIAWHHAHGAA